MANKVHVTAADLRGVSRLAVDATLGLAHLVETLHQNILGTPGVLGEGTQQPARGITGFVYKSIRGVTRLVGTSVEAVLARFAALFGKEPLSSPQRELVLGVLNGVLGDHLRASANPLAIPMQFRRDGVVFEATRESIASAMPQATGKILLLVHGLCMSDLQWRRNGHDHGVALAEASGFTPVYLRYNTGLHVSENGNELAARMEGLLQAWPVPVDELAILAHSMGGLVARSACHYAEVAGYGWRAKLRKMFFLGTPHHGAPLERGGHWLDVVLDASPYTTAFARLGKMRSAGITDLRHGSMLDADWNQEDRFAHAQRRPGTLPLPEGVACYAMAAVIAKKSGRLTEKLLGDGLVPLPSALGQHKDPARRPGFRKDRQWVGYGMHHLDLLDRQEVFMRMLSWL